MSSTYGEQLKLSLFGQSHGAAIGMVLDGIPAGLPVDMAALQAFLARRAPGQGNYATPRKEPDMPEFLSGVVDGFTCGAPVCAVIRNTNTRPGDYAQLKDVPRPGHADYTAQIKYGGYQDASGGGHFSGRLTATICMAGGLCLQWLKACGVSVAAHMDAVAGARDIPFDPCHPQINQVGAFPVLDPEAGRVMLAAIDHARENGDSVGGSVECAVVGLPAGIGEPMFGGVESKLAQILFGIPAVKGVEFGNGFQSTMLLGSENNDPFVMENGVVRTTSNRCGGILGGISNGMPLIFRVAFKPTPSIRMTQGSVSLSSKEERPLSVPGRHDPCIVPRAVPVVEAAAAIGIFDLLLVSRGNQKENLLW